MQGEGSKRAGPSRGRLKVNPVARAIGSSTEYRGTEVRIDLNVMSQMDDLKQGAELNI